MSAQQQASPPPEFGTSAKVFSPAEANRSLVLVSRVVQELVNKYRRLIELRDARYELSALAGNTDALERVDREAGLLRHELIKLDEELKRVGCVLKDWVEGLVDFPARYQGRPVWLCWRLGEPQVAYWHELQAGFAGRQPVGPDFS